MKIPVFHDSCLQGSRTALKPNSQWDVKLTSCLLVWRSCFCTQKEQPAQRSLTVTNAFFFPGPHWKGWDWSQKTEWIVKLVKGALLLMKCAFACHRHQGLDLVQATAKFRVLIIILFKHEITLTFFFQENCSTMHATLPDSPWALLCKSYLLLSCTEWEKSPLGEDIFSPSFHSQLYLNLASLITVIFH